MESQSRRPRLEANWFCLCQGDGNLQWCQYLKMGSQKEWIPEEKLCNLETISIQNSVCKNEFQRRNFVKILDAFKFRNNINSKQCLYNEKTCQYKPFPIRLNVLASTWRPSAQPEWFYKFLWHRNKQTEMLRFNSILVFGQTPELWHLAHINCKSIHSYHIVHGFLFTMAWLIGC